LLNQTTHNNHYIPHIPQFYLKNWSKDGNSIFVYSLLVPDFRIPYWNHRKIKFTAVWNDFYTRNEGEKEIDDFEKWFDREFEVRRLRSLSQQQTQLEGRGYKGFRENGLIYLP